MSEISKAELSPDQKAALLLREKLCDEFEQAVAGGQQPAIEDYLQRAGAEAQLSLLRELLLIELHYRDRLGKESDVDHYRRRFPLHSLLIEELVGNKHLWQSPQIESAKTVLSSKHKPPTLVDRKRRIHIRCPHCHEAMDVATDGPLTGVVCEVCGSQFSLAGDEYQHAPCASASIGHFELTSRIGVGGFGTIWRAMDTKLDRVVAVKIPRSNMLDSRQALQFIHEARAAAQLSHPNIVSVHEVGRDDDTIYIVSDFVDGMTLSDWLEARHPTRRQCVEVCIKIATALHHAHEAGIIHRDMKASNVLIDQEGEPRITDFGLAKRETVEATIGEDGKIFGTPAYMSPEQARGEGHYADRRTDVYSLGVMLYQLLTEELPFRGNTAALLHQVLNDEPPSPRTLDETISRDLDTICLKCLEKDPDKRYQTALELAEELRHYQRREPITSRPISRTERAWRWCRRKPMAATAAALLAVIALASPIIAVRERLHFLNERALNEENTKLIQRMDQKNAKLEQQLAAATELAAYRDRGKVSEASRKFMHLAYDEYQAAADQMLHSDATREERCMATLGLAILAMEVRPPDEALTLLLKARDELEAAERNSTGNLQLKAALAFCYDALAEFYGKSGQPVPSREYGQKAELAWSRLAQAAPTLATYLADYDAKTQNQLRTAETAASASNIEQTLSALTPDPMSRRNLDAFLPRSARQLYETACELANCRPWLTHKQTAAQSDKTTAAKDASAPVK